MITWPHHGNREVRHGAASLLRAAGVRFLGAGERRRLAGDAGHAGGLRPPLCVLSHRAGSAEDAMHSPADWRLTLQRRVVSVTSQTLTEHNYTVLSGRGSVRLRFAGARSLLDRMSSGRSRVIGGNRWRRGFRRSRRPVRSDERPEGADQGDRRREERLGGIPRDAEHLESAITSGSHANRRATHQPSTFDRRRRSRRCGDPTR